MRILCNESPEKIILFKFQVGDVLLQHNPIDKEACHVCRHIDFLGASLLTPDGFTFLNKRAALYYEKKLGILYMRTKTYRKVLLIFSAFTPKEVVLTAFHKRFKIIALFKTE